MEETQKQQMLPIGTFLQDGKYRVVRYLASGGFGNTYEVEHVKLHKHYALKEFFMRGINLRMGITVTVSQSENRPTFNQMREKFYHEAQRLATLEDAHIVEVSDFFEENETVYYVMKLIEGNSLSNMLKKRNTPFSEQEVRRILPQMLSALKYVHSQDLYHLDLKPANIMMNSEGHCWLIDFGASKQLSAQESLTLSTSTGLCYTPGYAPSEQINGNTKRIGPWTDFYALGATLYNLLTNQAPPSSDDIMDNGAAAFNFPTTVSSEMRQLIVHLMKQPPRERPQSVEEIILKKAEESQPARMASPSTSTRLASATNPTRPATPIPPKKNMAWAIVPVGCLVVGLFFLALIIMFNALKSCRTDREPVKMEYPLDESEEKTDTIFPADYPPAEEQEPVADENLLIFDNLINNMVRVQGGTFQMGSEDSEAESDEQPIHTVTVSSFYIGKYEVTQREWEAVMGSNPSEFRGANRPVENVSWYDCNDFISKLNEKTGLEFRFPTEAEWEFAAQGGINNNDYYYVGSNYVGEVAWYKENSSNMSHEVGRKSPNSLGLYDMSGNVREWCKDYYDEGYYWNSPSDNPCNYTASSNRVNRSCSWGSNSKYCRVANRDGLPPSTRYSSLGLRLALDSK